MKWFTPFFALLTQMVPATNMLLAHCDTMKGPVVIAAQKAMGKKNFEKDDITAGREYVKEYVEFIHYVEQLYQAAKPSAGGHILEPKVGDKHDVH